MRTSKKVTPPEDVGKAILELREAQEETWRQIRETSEQLKETDRRFNTQWGKLIESLVEGDIVNLFSERKIPVQGTTQRMKTLFKGQEYEFDIVVHNGDEIIVVEVKTTLDVHKVNHFLDKLKLFRDIFPDYKNKKVYGAVAYLVANSSADKYSEKQKLFVIRATGNSSTIINAKDFKPKAF